MIERQNPTSEKSGDIVVLAVLAIGGLLVAKQATTPGTSLHKLFFPGSPNTPVNSGGNAGGSTTTAAANPSAPWESCQAYNAPVDPSKAGGFVGSVRQLFERTYPAGSAYAFSVWQSQGGRC